MNKLFEIIYWVKIFLSPFIIFLFIALAIYFSNEELLWISILLSIIGLVLGIVYAERIRKKHGTTQYMGKIYNTDDISDYNEIIDGKKND
ncbi:SoxR reducing system RseC family protein [Flavobacterium microcysteis]|uniref:SoxR reducing system RseC family protein n=1 Tax=Flavobacterium microcysteis TaxID=2596891 RepID=A0A501QBI9_9FLAO|nr:SoxR reducing system RseC family protein [Flavobacterium microcysteis]TPD69788.1 SoxR reducing system RseC family protein [Flavobacterium microcysteis]